MYNLLLTTIYLVTILKHVVTEPWVSSKIPKEKPDCGCKRWKTKSSDTKWQTKNITDIKVQRKIGTYFCKYGILLQRQKCISSTRGENRCDKNIVRTEEAYYLKRSECVPNLQQTSLQEQCGGCEKKFKRIFTLCYARQNTRKHNGTVFYCKVDWTKCTMPDHCNRKPEYQIVNVKISDDCKESTCTDGVTRGLVHYTTECRNSATLAGYSMHYNYTCDPSTFELELQKNTPCSNLPRCDKIAATITPRTVPDKPTKAQSSSSTVASPKSLVPCRDEVTDASTSDKDGYDIFTHPVIPGTHPPPMDKIQGALQPITAASDVSTSDDDVAVTSHAYSPFFVAMTVIGIILFVVIVCLVTAVCYIILFEDKGRRMNIYEMVRRSRDSLERGYDRMSSFVFRRSHQHQTDNEMPSTEESQDIVETNQITADVHEVKEDNENDGCEYWAVSDQNGEKIQPFVFKNSDSTKSFTNRLALNDHSETPQKIPGSQSHGILGANQLQSPPSPPIGEITHFASVAERQPKKRISCPSDWRTGIRLSTFLDDQPALRNKEQHLKIESTSAPSFDDIISEISTLRRDLSFITNRTNTDFSSINDDGLRSIFSDSSSSNESLGLPPTALTISDKIMPIQYFDRPYSTRSSLPGSNRGLPAKNQPLAAQLCSVTPSAQNAPAISVFHPRERGFGMIRERDDVRIGKIVIDTTRAKHEVKNTDVRTANSHLSLLERHGRPNT